MLINNSNDLLISPIISSKRERHFCCIKNCGRLIETRKTGLCAVHQRRYAKGVDLLLPIREFDKIKCDADKCYKKYFSKGFCLMHYYRNKRNGSPLIVLRDRNQGGKCIIEGCKKFPASKKLCAYHYNKKNKDIRNEYDSRR